MKTKPSRFWLLLLLVTTISQSWAVGVRPACCPSTKEGHHQRDIQSSNTRQAVTPIMTHPMAAETPAHCQMSVSDNEAKVAADLAAVTHSDCSADSAMQTDCDGEGHCHCPIGISISAMPTQFWLPTLMVDSRSPSTYALQCYSRYSASLYRPPIVA